MSKILLRNEFELFIFEFFLKAVQILILRSCFDSHKNCVFESSRTVSFLENSRMSSTTGAWQRIILLQHMFFNSSLFIASFEDSCFFKSMNCDHMWPMRLLHVKHLTGII